MDELYFNGIWRMDWGLGNPNKTAALIAILMVAVWGLAYVRKWGFWVAITLFMALGGCLVHTFSRGGLIAAGLGGNGEGSSDCRDRRFLVELAANRFSTPYPLKSVIINKKVYHG